MGEDSLRNQEIPGYRQVVPRRAVRVVLQSIVGHRKASRSLVGAEPKL